MKMLEKSRQYYVVAFHELDQLINEVTDPVSDTLLRNP